MADIDPFLVREAAQLVDTMRARFTPPEYIPGCEITSVADINEYATNNGWVEAICGQHNVQRVRWKSGEAVSVAGYIDVLYFRDRRDRKRTRLNSSHGYISYAVS